MKTVDILMFEGVEVMDFAAPFELFSLAGTKIAPGSLSVRTVGREDAVTCRNGLVVRPASRCNASDRADVLVVPGGPGVQPVLESDRVIMDYLAQVAPHASWILAVCSGSLILASLKLLRNGRASSHHSDLDALRRLEPTVQVEHGKRFVQHGRVVTSDGISAGLDASLFVIARLLGRQVAAETADWAEYRSMDWDREGDAPE